MNFNEEQQAHIDKLISKKYAEAMSKAEAKAAEQLAASEAAHAGELQTLKAENEALKASRGEQNARMKTALLKAEIAVTSAVKPDQVEKLVSENISLGDDGNLKVVDDKGTMRLNEAGAPLSVKAFLEGFLQDNPHLVAASGRSGTGSFSSVGFGKGGRTMHRAEFEKLDSARKKHYLQSGGSLTD